MVDKINTENYEFRGKSTGFDSGFPNREFEQGIYYVYEHTDGRKYRVIEFDGEDKVVLAHEIAHMYGADEELASEIAFRYASL